MLNRSASLAMSTSVLKALPGKLDIKRHSPSNLYIDDSHHEYQDQVTSKWYKLECSPLVDSDHRVTMCRLICLFRFDALHPSQQFFSHVRIIK